MDPSELSEKQSTGRDTTPCAKIPESDNGTSEQDLPPAPVHTTFAQDETDMFVQVGRCTAGQFETCLLESEDAVDAYLQNDDPSSRHCDEAPGGRFFLFDPCFGWGRLQITEEAMSKIATHYGIFPAFLRQLSVFGEKGFARDEGFGAYEALNHYGSEGEITCFESCFLWKYVELGGSDGRYAHSIRQGLIYQKFDVKSKQSTNILVRVPRMLAAQMKASLTSTNGESPQLLEQWTGLQMMCAASGLDEWRGFVNYLDQQVSQLFDSIILAGANVSTTEQADELQYRLTSMKRLQFFIDQILRAGHMLELNKTTIGAMIRAFSRRRDTLENTQELQHRLEDLQQEHEYLAKMAKNVLDRAVMLSHELRDTIALRNHEINKTSNDAAARGTRAIVELSRKSAYEARVVKLLSVVAVVFLPASFAADFLQMGYLFVTEDNRFKVHATADLWLYAIFAIPLLVVTISVYAVFEMLSRRKAKRQAFLIRETKTEDV